MTMTVVAISFHSGPNQYARFKIISLLIQYERVDISKTQTELRAYSARLLSESLQFSLLVVTRMKEPFIADLDVHVRQDVPPVCSIGRM